jgi:hypothetical protein
MTRPIVTPWSRLRRLFHDLGALFLLGLVISAVAGQIPPPSPQTPRPGSGPDADDLPGSGITMNSQVLDIWLPERLVDLARREPRSVQVRTYQGLRKPLELQDDQSLFYALRVRQHARLESADITFVRDPDREPGHLQEFLDVLATAAGSPPRYPSLEYDNATIHVMPMTTSRQELVQAIQALTSPRGPLTPRSESSQ